MRQLIGVVLVVGTSPLLIVCVVVKALNAAADLILDFMKFILEATWGQS